MRYELISEHQIGSAAAKFAANLVQSDGDRVFVVHNDTVNIFASDMSPLYSVVAEESITSIDVSRRFLLIQCGSTILAKAHESSAFTKISPSHGDPLDHYCVDEQYCWFVSSDRHLCAFDLSSSKPAFRRKLDSSWFAGSLWLRRAPGKRVVIDVAMEQKLGVVSIGESMNFQESPGQVGYVLGVEGTDLICYADRLQRVAIDELTVVETYQCDVPCQDMASLGDGTLLVGVHCVFLLRHGTVSDVEFGGPGVPSIYRAISLEGGRLVTVHRGGVARLWRRK